MERLIVLNFRKFMKFNKLNTFEEYKSCIDYFKPIKKFSNDYIQTEAIDLILHDKLYEAHTSSNLFLFVKNEVGYRLYYYIAETCEIADFSNFSNILVEILYRGEKFYPSEEIDYLCKCGFKVNLIRDQYCGVFNDLTDSKEIDGIEIRLANSIEEVAKAANLFNQSFDTLSGDYVSDDCFDYMLANGNILLATNISGSFLGALHQSVDRGVAWVRHLAVVPEARGRHVGRALLDTFVQSNFTTNKQRYMLWVQQKNNAAVNLYVNKGFKYLNKSTISLIKY